MPTSSLQETLTASGVDTTTLSQPFDPDDPTIYTLTVPGEQAIHVWSQLRGMADETGYYPVVLGGVFALGQHVEDVSLYDYIPPADIVQRANDLDVAAWLKSRYEALGYSGELGEWPADRGANSGFTVPYDWSPTSDGRNYLPEVYIALLPTPNSWEVPAYLHYGGWGYTPEPEAIVALLKYWHDTYGAEVICFSLDTLEMSVTHSAQDRDTALSLAAEQYALCPDLLGEQSYRSLSDLAASLLNADVWWLHWK
jgi:Domain of unknown function (DUF4253)